MIAALILGAAAARAPADQIITPTVTHTRVKVSGYVDGGLHLLQSDGSMTAVPLAEASRMVIDSVGQMADFNEAERYLEENQLQKALVRYERAKRVATDFWPAVIEVRLLQANDRAGRLDRAVKHFVAVAQNAPQAAAALMPQSIPKTRTPPARRAAERLEADSRRATTVEQAVLLGLLRYDILSRGGYAQAGKLAGEVAATLIPPAIATRRVFAVKVAARDKLLEVGGFDAAMASVNADIEGCPLDILPELLLQKGRALFGRASGRDDLLAAGVTLMRIAIHFPDHELAPEGLYWAARVHTRLDRPHQAAQLLGECLAHALTSDALARLAEEELSRLEGEPSP